MHEAKDGLFRCNEAVLLHEASAAAAIGAIGTAANYLCKASATLLQRFC